MGLRDEIKPYTDAYGLVSPHRCDPYKQGSDNGPMFTSEYFIMLARSGALTDSDAEEFENLILACVANDLLCRAPGDVDQEGPDDYYGVFAACSVLQTHDLGLMFLDSVFSHHGFLNNHDGKRTWQSFLIRQPQLLAAAYAAANRAPVWSWPLYWYAAMVIATSCIGVDPNDTDSRRLSWLLIQAVGAKSFLCRLAAKVWFKRLRRDYGGVANDTAMRLMASLYYEPGHPFTRYWKA